MSTQVTQMSNSTTSTRLKSALQPAALKGSVAAALALFALAAPQQAAAEIDVSVYTGWQTAPHSTVSGNDPAGIGAFDFTAGWTGESFSAPPYYGIRAVWWQNDRWGYDIDFNHTKVYADSETLGATGKSGGFQVLEFTDGLNALTVGAVRRWEDGFGRITPYAGAGIGVAIPHVEVQTAPGAPKTFGYQIGGPAVSWRVGGTMDINESWGVFAEYKGTYSMLDVDLDGGGNLKSNIVTNALNFGVQYTFD
jgi:lipid A oxidase